MLRTALISALTAALICSVLMVVRSAEASRNASGTFTLYTPGNPVVTSTTINSAWANNTLSDIKTEITDSLSRSGKGAMLQPLQLYDGTVNAPGLTYGTETGTGLYRIGASDIGFAINQVKVFEFTSSGVTIPSGKSLTVTVSPTTITPNTSITAGNGLAYWKDAGGTVHVKGTVTNATGGTTQNLVTTTPLAAGFRPNATNGRSFTCSDGNGARTHHLNVASTGAITEIADSLGNAGLINGNTAYLDCISFLAEQ